MKKVLRKKHEKSETQRKNNSKGITLIALVITIVLNS